MMPKLSGRRLNTDGLCGKVWGNRTTVSLMYKPDVKATYFKASSNEANGSDFISIIVHNQMKWRYSERSFVFFKDWSLIWKRETEQIDLQHSTKKNCFASDERFIRRINDIDFIDSRIRNYHIILWQSIFFLLLLCFPWEWWNGNFNNKTNIKYVFMVIHHHHFAWSISCDDYFRRKKMKNQQQYWCSFD